MQYIRGCSLKILHTLSPMVYAYTSVGQSYCGSYCVIGLVIIVSYHSMYVIYYHQIPVDWRITYGIYLNSIMGVVVFFKALI